MGKTSKTMNIGKPSPGIHTGAKELGLAGEALRKERALTRKLRQEMLRLAVVLHDSSDAIIIQDMDGKITTWNRGAEKMYDYSAEEALGMNIAQITPAGKLAEQKEYFRLLATGEAVDSFETQRIAKDGSILYVWLTVTKVLERPTDSVISTGQAIVQPVGFALLERNITERKQAEENLRASEEKYRIANEELAFQGEEKDKRAAELVIANEELAFQNKEKAARAAELVIANEELVLQKEALKQSEEKDKRAAELAIANKELAFQNKEKAARAAELVIANEELVLQKEALKQSEEQYRSLVVNINDVICTLNAEGVVTYISPVIERFAGYKAEEVIGKPFINYIYPEDQQGLMESLRQTLSGQVEPAEFRLLRKDGAYIYVRSVSRRIVENGQASLTGVLSDITERKRAEDELRESHAKLAKTFEQTVVSLASIAEMRDPYTAGHQVRVAGLACRIASEIGMSAEQIGAIRTAALLHDIGKIIVPPEIWNKPGKLNVIERSFVEAHAQASYDILKTIDFELPIAEIVRQHHEKLDGSGYPQGLSGDSILKEARILTVADIVEAMASHRPYRPALPLKVALEEIGSHRGTLYDADAVDACLRLFSRKGFKQSVWH
jgi:PAS domain S-box-containing protein/putative nucleotidyltransferase with HDIG domain